MKILRNLDVLHPIMFECVKRIQTEIIDVYDIPIKIFETGRAYERHKFLLEKGKTQSVICKHAFNLELDPPLYAVAIDYVYFDKKWSWNFRDSTIKSWYILFGNLVLDLCPELTWYGLHRKNTNYSHFELKEEIIEKYQDKYPCVRY